MTKTVNIGEWEFPVAGHAKANAIQLLDLPMLDDHWERLPCAGDNTRYWPTCLLSESKKFS